MAKVMKAMKAPKVMKAITSDEEIDQVKAPGTTTNFEAGARYCPHCEMWLNGPSQWKHHKKGKKHWKNTPKHWKQGQQPSPALNKIIEVLGKK